ncbi:uncharacterized protein LOC127103728 [Lathyrus oleraceus]|uniref:uncharacterized protein LOC127103728 n=1 Tax=Pisum sativum TaxID=3888 RepID=UPI0021D27410|nr:uncharacterized protein LOC127103728 [Pisum sativum]
MKARVASSTPMMDSSHVVLDVVPLSMVPCHVSVQNKMRPPSIKKEHSIISLYLVPIKSANVSAKEFICSKLVSRVEPSGSSASEKSNKVVSIDDPVSMNAKENQDVSNDEESLGGRKEKSNVIVNFNELDSDEETIAKNMATGIAKRLKNRISKVVMTEGMPSKAAKKHVSVGSTKSWRKVTANRKRNEVSSSESDFDVEHDVWDITPVLKKILVNVPEVPLDNISFHSVENVDRWKFIYQRRLALERELRKDALECNKVMKLIEHAGLMKSVTDCDNKKNKDFIKVFVRGKCVQFSLDVINRYMVRCEDEQVEIEVTDNLVCKEITTKQVPANHTSTIAIGLGKFIYVIGTKTNFDFEAYVFEQTLKHVGTCAVKMPIAFPSLICGVTISQHPDFVQVLRAADQLERDLVQIVVEDSVDSDDGGKAVTRRHWTWIGSFAVEGEILDGIITSSRGEVKRICSPNVTSSIVTPSNEFAIAKSTIPSRSETAAVITQDARNGFNLGGNNANNLLAQIAGLDDHLCFPVD